MFSLSETPSQSFLGGGAFGKAAWTQTAGLREQCNSEQIEGDMSGKTDLPCSEFQANVFNKSRCQNCFKPQELHLMRSEELEQAKPIYASWLCLAPEGTDFDNPMQRSRKWQRRFFILYEHGSLQFALDELPSTIPQGTVDLNLCSEVIDAEARTGQKNALCIITPEQEVFIRGDSKEIINGWSEQLAVFPQTNKQKQLRKRNRTSVQSQDQASTDETVCGTGTPETEAAVGNEPCSPKQEGGQSMKTGDDSLGSGKAMPFDLFREMCRVDSAEGSHSPQGLSCSSPESDCFPLECSLPQSSSTLASSSSSVDWEPHEDTDSNTSSHAETSSLTQAMETDASTDQHQAVTHEECDSEDSCFMKYRRIEDGSLTNERKGEMCQRCRKRGRSKSQNHTIQNKGNSAGFLGAPQSSLHPQRRTRSLDGKATDSTMTPDLLNFKKGWLLSLDDNKQWRKYWFVLSAHSLRYYSDSGAEEASELVGEIDLTACHKVTEHLVQRNYGFQLHTLELVYTLAAMTAGIRQNWVQALTKNIQNRNAPDVASLADNHLLQVETLCGPDVTQDSRSAAVSTQHCVEHCPGHDKRHGCAAKTFDWDEIVHNGHFMDQEGNRKQVWLDVQTEKKQEKQGSKSRRRAREERRQRYKTVMGSSSSLRVGRSSLDSPEQQQQQQRMREIEERWLQVEKTAFREGRKVPLFPQCQSKSTAEMEKLLDHYQNRVEQLTIQLTDRSQSLEEEHSADWSWQKQMHDLGAQYNLQKMDPNKKNPLLTLTDKYQETKQLLQQENLRRQQIKSQLGLCPSAQIKNEPDVKNGCNLLRCEMMFNKSSLGSHAWCEASGDREDEYCRAKVDGFSERAALAENENIGPDPTLVKRFSQEAELLARENELLDRHNQELLNQLAEANREIDRLKAELLPPNGCQPDLQSMAERLEMELARSCGQLQEAQNQLAEMEENLNDTHRTLQLREATIRGLGFLSKDSEKINKIPSLEKTDGLCQSVQVLEITISELESQLCLSEQACRELQAQNALLRESELLNGQRIIEAEEKIRMLQGELEPDTSSQWEGLMHVKNQKIQNGVKSSEGIQFAVEESVRMKSSVLGTLLQVIRRLDGNEKQDCSSELENAQVNPREVRWLQLEKIIWESFVNALEDNKTEGMESEGADCLLWCAKMKLGEMKTYLSLISTSTNSSKPLSLRRDSEPSNLTNMSLCNLDIIGIHDGTIKEEQKEHKVSIGEELGNGLIWRVLKQHVEKRLTLLNNVASKLESSTSNEKQCDICRQTNEFYPTVSAAMDIVTACLMGTLDVHMLPIFEPFYSNTNSIEVQTESYEKRLEPNNGHETAEANEEHETESGNTLRSRVKELEHLLSEYAERLTSLQQQHEEDKDRLKMEIMAVYEQGFTLLEESHQKLTEDLLRKHQQEQELLQEEKERLLAEEAAATLTVIEAMRRAHCSELEKVLQKANQEKSSGDTSIDEILKNHREELASMQRELDALSKEYSQKCLETVHMSQALETERKDLQHCQHQNVALRAQNQMLNNHLAEEVLRLSTVAKDGTSPLSGDRQQYELQIMLRLRESEIIYLKQQISTLKNELKTAQTDQKLAFEGYQTVQTDLSMVREKAEQQTEQLKEHLRLAYEALAESMEKKTSAADFNAAHHGLNS